MNQKGAVPIFIITTLFFIVSAIVIANFIPYRDQIFSLFYKEPASFASGTIFWSAGMETGDMDKNDSQYGTSEWQINGGGGEFNSGTADTEISTDFARSGTHSAKATIYTPNNSVSGTRLFRWAETRKYKQAYYSVWAYFPTQYTLTNSPATGQFLNLMQFKSRTMDDKNDPVWAFYLQPDGQNGLKIVAGWGWGGTTLSGPKPTDGVSGKFYDQTITSIPIGKWVHLEAFLNQSTGNIADQTSNYDGQIKFWQDGQLLYDFQNIRTGYYNNKYTSDGNTWNTSNEWAVNNYSDGTSPDPATIYFDDAVIADSQQWSQVSPSPSADLIESPTITPTPTPPISPTATPTQIPTPSPLVPDLTPPTVSITSPANGAVIVGRKSYLTINASASDNIGVAKVEFYVNRSLRCSDTLSPYTCNFKTNSYNLSQYNIQAKAYDTSGMSASTSITIKTKYW